MTLVPLDRIRIDGDTQPWVATDLTVAEKYAYAMTVLGAKFPPLDVFFDGTDYWLADGFHRHSAYKGFQAQTLGIFDASN